MSLSELFQKFSQSLSIELPLELSIELPSISPEISNIGLTTAKWIALYGLTYGALKVISYHPYFDPSDQSITEEPINAQVSLFRRPIFQQHLASRTVSMVHAVGTIILSTQILLDQTQWNLVNTPLQNQMMHFSLSYYLADLAYITVWEWDPIFVLHHSVMVVYWLSTLYLNRGGFLGAFFMLPGEITNPVQLPWDIARRYKIQSLLKPLTPLFTYSFLLVRCGVIPTITPFIWYRVWKQPSPSRSWKLLWVFLSLNMIGAGLTWSRHLWVGYLRYLRRLELANLVE